MRLSDHAPRRVRHWACTPEVGLDKHPVAATSTAPDGGPLQTIPARFLIGLAMQGGAAAVSRLGGLSQRGSQRCVEPRAGDCRSRRRTAVSTCASAARPTQHCGRCCVPLPVLPPRRRRRGGTAVREKPASPRKGDDNEAPAHAVREVLPLLRFCADGAPHRPRTCERSAGTAP
jgi:hypothetical protein